MHVKTIWQRSVLHVAVLAAAVIGLLLVAGLLDAALAQSVPFGAPRAQAPAVPVGGVLGWIFAKQAEFYRQFSSLIRAAKSDRTAAWSLFGLSFFYGIFHAAGPGHGKAVISSYMVANEETWTRGVVLSFASALFQALVAVALVGVVAALRTPHRPAAVGAAVTPADHGHGHAHRNHAQHGHGHHDHGHDSHGHDHRHHHHHHDDHSCGNAHAHHHHDHDDHAAAWGHAHAP